MSLGARIYAELRGDKVLWTIMALFALLSVLLVYSSTSTLAFKERDGNTEAYVMKHIGILVMGLIGAYFAFLMHYMKYNKFAPYLLITAIPLLAFTLMFGPEVNDANRWIRVPVVGLTFQTSDFARLALIIYVARAITAKQDYIKDFQSAFVPIIVPIILIVLLIAPSDLSTALILFAVCTTMMYVGRVALKYIGLLFFAGIVSFAFLIIVGQLIPGTVRVDTWKERIESFVYHSNEEYQVQQGKIAISQGGWFGQGPGNSFQKNYLPNPFSDYLYSIIHEEYGIIGGFIVLGLYVLLFVRCVRLVTISPKTFGALLVIGLGLNIVIPAFANMAVSVNLVPVTGLNLPMLSMGGTSIIVYFISLGIILSVSKYVEKAI